MMQTVDALFSLLAKRSGPIDVKQARTYLEYAEQLGVHIASYMTVMRFVIALWMFSCLCIEG